MKMIKFDFQILISGMSKSDVDFAMESWMYNDLDMPTASKKRKDYFDTSKYKKYLINAKNGITESFLL